MKKKNLILINLLLVASLFCYAEDYYWVGGQGTWSDLNSWRTTNGQIPNEVPDGSDNVIFNENSFLHPFDTVFILTGNPTCNNFTWENIQDTVVIKGGSYTTTFSIYGSVTLHPKLINSYFGKIFLMSDLPGTTITCAGSKFAFDVYFKGNGEWILQDTLFLYDSTDWKVIIFGDEDGNFITDDEGNVLTWASAGGIGMKGSKKGTAYAGGLAAQNAASKAIKNNGLRRVRVRVNGPGSSRETAVRSLEAEGLEVISVQDITSIPHNGCRPPKARRV